MPKAFKKENSKNDENAKNGKEELPTRERRDRTPENAPIHRTLS